jgi:hypothetical protein
VTVVEHFAAATIADGVALLEKLPLEGPALAVLHEEDEIAKACFEQAGFVWLDTEVEASSTILGYYGREVDIAPLTDPVELSTMALLKSDFLSQAQLDAALAEVEQAGEFAQHYAKYNKRHSCRRYRCRVMLTTPRSLNVQTKMGKAWKQEHAALLAEPLRLTTLAPSCPVLMSITDMIPGKTDRIRLMKLRAKDGELARHADTTLVDAGVADGKLARLHIPLDTNPHVVFTQWDARGKKHERHFAAGSLFYLDQRKPHRAVNEGDTDRVHLVVDIHSTPALRELIASPSAP